jgi:quercetin dioxygenase-like cupin family protein
MDTTDDTTDGAARPGIAAPLPVDLRDWVRFSTAEATRVRVLRTTHLAVDLWCIEPRQATDVLVLRDADVTYTVLAGRSWFATAEGDIGLDPLGALLVPAGTLHGIDNRAPDPLIVMAVSSPPDALAPESPVSDAATAVRNDPAPGGGLRGVLGRIGRDRGSRA